jgi:molybdenum cofactor cytidylyltransferase
MASVVVSDVLRRRRDHPELEAERDLALEERVWSLCAAEVQASRHAWTITAGEERRIDFLTRGIVLAAGQSQRFGAQNKLLWPLHGATIVRRTVEAYVSALGRIIVVVQPGATSLRDELIGLDIDFVVNLDFAAGMSTSVRVGLSSVGTEFDAALVGVADQPLLTAAVVERVARAVASSYEPIVVPYYAGTPGNPSGYHRSVFPDLMALTGDAGGRQLWKVHSHTRIDVDDAMYSVDVDTIENCHAAEGILRARERKRERRTMSGE